MGPATIILGQPKYSLFVDTNDGGLRVIKKDGRSSRGMSEVSLFTFSLNFCLRRISRDLLKMLARTCHYLTKHVYANVQ
jgi:hypothetical protein